MSAILSSDDLNDFISPGVACIKPVETLPAATSKDDHNPYEVTTEYQVAAQNAAAPASISLTDCLACSGCVTSAEAVLVSLQSHNEVLNMLDAHPDLDVGSLLEANGQYTPPPGAKVFVASVSPQVRASIATTYGISDVQAGYMIDQFLSGPHGLRRGGQKLSAFQYVVDTNRLRDVCLVLGAAEVETALKQRSTASKPSLPILSSACPGWVCYAEKTHPHILPHLSALKSAQAVSGTLLKSVLCQALGIQPSQIWHLAIMPCFDKKLEASRTELTNEWWQPTSPDKSPAESSPVRDVDCVITSRELLSLASARGVQLSALPLEPASHPQFPVPRIADYVFPSPQPQHQRRQRRHQSVPPPPEAGSSGGYLYYILKSQQAAHPNSQINVQRGRNADVVEYTLRGADNQTILSCARYYGFRNIQNLVRKLKPARQSKLPGAAVRRVQKDSGASNYVYVEVMACPGGCTNGGGQIKVDDVAAAVQTNLADDERLKDTITTREGRGALAQKEWLRRVDEAYFSADDQSDSDDTHNHDYQNKEEGKQDESIIWNINTKQVRQFLHDWEAFVSVPREKLAYTTFRAVESDVGKTTKAKASQMTDTQRIANIAGLSGGGW